VVGHLKGRNLREVVFVAGQSTHCLADGCKDAAWLLVAAPFFPRGVASRKRFKL
jgi:hypothetical protein